MITDEQLQNLVNYCGILILVLILIHHFIHINGDKIGSGKNVSMGKEIKIKKK
ncbi:hypothetical protein K502DRAFT_326039 [Neoconidiobolus thromboides FSU 785]|nr:hypothetical protein K502DRAFT_326039 [Neoconidiobolus thromboides FSU 785]